jgi:hypothetical protein
MVGQALIICTAFPGPAWASDEKTSADHFPVPRITSPVSYKQSLIIVVNP